MKWTLILIMAASLIGRSPCAHAMLEHAEPAVGSEISASPSALTLTYSEAVEPSFSTVTVTNAGGERVDRNTLSTRNDNRVLVVPLNPLLPGAYTVEWHVTSVNTHKTQGHFSFTMKP